MPAVTAKHPGKHTQAYQGQYNSKSVEHLKAMALGCGGGGNSAFQGCRDLADYSGNAPDLPHDPISSLILDEAAGTHFAIDLSYWMKEMTSGDYQAAAYDGDKVVADCAAVGVSIGLLGNI